jgi:hypothetical protein
MPLIFKLVARTQQKRSRIALIYLFWMIFASPSSFRFSTPVWFGKTLDPGDVFHVGAGVGRQILA